MVDHVREVSSDAEIRLATLIGKLQPTKPDCRRTDVVVLARRDRSVPNLSFEEPVTRTRTAELQPVPTPPRTSEAVACLLGSRTRQSPEVVPLQVAKAYSGVERRHWSDKEEAPVHGELQEKAGGERHLV